ncbi:hypothetical protein D9601_03070 [Sphingomonas sp. MA1305]|uniref:hypothetical protein n=1 Tax=Sphingomonas sp. MA1305 TaxID=2479204 RepID=UPI0018E002C2|nr:hypothetical protein [Sphingomonas sp. MA1305]MBI0474345.1 hypothetical protein [Sphingomonas sp. MA1305]
MAPPRYDIRPDANARFLRVTLSGDWDVAISERFATDIAERLRTMLAGGVRHGELRTLIDMRDKMVLPQQAAAHFTRLIRPGGPSKRIALLASGALHRLQVKRFIDDRCRLFEHETDAMAWLLAEPAQDAAPADD